MRINRPIRHQWYLSGRKSFCAPGTLLIGSTVLLRLLYVRSICIPRGLVSSYLGARSTLIARLLTGSINMEFRFGALGQNMKKSTLADIVNSTT